MVERGFDDRPRPLARSDAVSVPDGLPTVVVDFAHRGIGCTWIGPLAGDRRTEIVDDDASSTLGEKQCVPSSQPAAGACDHCNASVENADQASTSANRLDADIESRLREAAGWE